MTDAPSAEDVERFLEANVVPERRAEPRVAEPLASVQRHSVPSPEGPVAAWRVGEGPAALLVHGFSDDNSLWAPLIDALRARGRSVVVLDLPGHGLSAGKWGLAPQMADGIHAVVAALGPVDAVVAHSAGSGGVLVAMSEGLNVDRAVFIAPPLGGSRNRWLRYAERLGVSEDVAHAAQSLYEERVGPTRAGFDVRICLTGLDLPILFVHSSADERFALDGTRDLVSQCKRAELLAVDELTHRKTARDPGVVARIADFVIGARP